MKSALLFLATLPLGISLALASGAQPNPPTVEAVEIERYQGLWHEKARIPNEFQDNTTDEGFGPCMNTTAEYTPLENSRIGVRNTCFRENGAGQSDIEVAEAIGKPVRDSNNSKLKVNFTGIAFLRWLGIGDGNYWIFALGPIDNEGLYSWALVGSPKFDYGWVLTRSAEVDDEATRAILERAKAIGFDVGKFKKTRF